MPERIYKTNLWLVVVFIVMFVTIFSVFNIYVFTSSLSPAQHLIICLVVAAYFITMALIHKVILYQDELIMRKTFSKKVVPYEAIHQITLKERYSGNYFVLLDEQKETLAEISVDLLGDHLKQHDFLDMLVSKNENIITE